MNYLAHAYPYLDDPYFAVGTGVPDWLAVVDRRARVRRRHARAYVDDPEPRTAAIAGGILRHLEDDERFHGSRTFSELSLELTVAARDVLDGETGLRPAFLGHLLVELLLDAAIYAGRPELLEGYYRVLDTVDAGFVEETVNRMAPWPTDRLAPLIRGFSARRILSEYAEDAKLLVCVNRVMRRLGLSPLPQGFGRILPEARRIVELRREELLG